MGGSAAQEMKCLMLPSLLYPSTLLEPPKPLALPGCLLPRVPTTLQLTPSPNSCQGASVPSPIPAWDFLDLQPVG